MDTRRSARYVTRFLLAIEGLDEDLAPIHGDISATGVYFETSNDVGEVGTVQWLHLASADESCRVDVMAYVVRSVTMAEVRRARVRGVAMEFMPESDEVAGALERFVRHVLATSADTSDKRTVRSVTLETNWAVAPGELVRIDVIPPGIDRRIKLTGRAQAVERGKAVGEFLVMLEVEEEAVATVRRSSTLPQAPSSSFAVLPEAPSTPAVGSVEDMLDSFVGAPDAPKPRREHLAGLLSRVPLHTLCALLEMERMSGEAILHRGERRAILYVRDGQLVDVEPVATGSTPRGAVAQLLRWNEGTFEFYVKPVTRADRIALSTTALLIDLAREQDEASAAAAASSRS